MHRQMITKALLAGAIAATLSVCVFGAAVPVQETGLSIRDPGDIAVFEDQKDLVKRVNAALVASALTALGAVTYAACQATAPIQPVVAATVCVVAAVSTWVGALATLWRGLQARDLENGLVATIGGVEYKHYYPASVDGPPALELLQRAFVGTPILVGHHTCEGHGCFQAHYSNHFHPELNKTVHRFTTSPRHASSLARRQDDMESGSADSDGGGKLFTDYDFQNDNIGDERAEGYDGGFPTRFLNLVGAETSYTQQGYACMSVVDTDDNNNIGAQGYITISQDENIADPQSEAGYIASCT